ncbi:MAG: hypothetical protein Kow0074_06860 [Candidatus Zixiibacteriota bacterium]
MIRRAISVLLVASLLCGCGDSSTAPQVDRIVEGVNITELFAPPTPAEIDAIHALWEAREITVAGFQIEATGSVDLDGTPGTVQVVSHLVDGHRHFGAIAYATNASPESRAILVYSHGGDDGENIDDVLSLLDFGFGGIPDDFIYVVPSFRSEPLRYQNVTYRSEGDPSPWDRDVDDALALVDATIANVSAADPERIGVVGFSRGACVGMLMAIRDPRIDLVVEFFGPTDFFSPFTQDVVEDALTGELRDLPGLNDLNEQLIQPLKDGALSIDEVRSAMLRRSPVYFADRLPQLQLHHGTADAVVPVTEAERLIAVMTELGRGEPEFEPYLYTNGTHNPILLPGSIGRAESFIRRLIDPVLTTTVLPSVVESQ